MMAAAPTTVYGPQCPTFGFTCTYVHCPPISLPGCVHTGTCGGGGGGGGGTAATLCTQVHCPHISLPGCVHTGTCPHISLPGCVHTGTCGGGGGEHAQPMMGAQQT